MPMPIAKKASDRLRFARNYRNLEGISDNTVSSLVNLLALDEQLLGIYEIIPGHAVDAILVTDRGLHVLAQSPKFISYDLIEDVNAEGSKQELKENEAMRKLKIKLGDGSTIELMIPGQHEEGGLDLYSFWTFLIGAMNLKRLERDKNPDSCKLGASG